MFKNSKKVLFFVVLLIAVNAFANPFTAKEKIETKKNKFLSTTIFSQKFVMYQYELNKKLSFFMREIKAKKNSNLLIIFLGVSFLYGFLHSLMPGHGKFFTLSFMLAEKRSFKEALIFTSITSFTHIFFSVLIILFLNFILKTTITGSFEEISGKFKIISYSIITFIGLFLFLKNVLKFFKKEINVEKVNKRDKTYLYSAFSVGLVPCTGVILIMLFAISINYIKLGLLSAFFQGLGMFLSLCLVSIFALLGKVLVVKKTKRFLYINVLIETVSALLILLVGLFLLLSL